MPAPVAFGSSTCEDMAEGGYRRAMEDGVKKAGFFPEMQEYWISRDNPPLVECLARVAEAELLVVAVAYRYGWVPPDQEGGEEKSITWLECEEAGRQGKEVLAFVVDEKYEWPAELKEEYRLALAAREGTAAELADEVQRNLARLGEFKQWLNSRGVRETFTTPEDLRGKIAVALLDWRKRHGYDRPPPPQPGQVDTTRYLEQLDERTSHIEIRGLQVGAEKAPRFPIDELYIPLTTSGGQAERGEPDFAEGGPREGRIELHRALRHRQLAIVGDPGAGKSTFLRLIANVLCRTHLGSTPDAAQMQLGLADNPLPILISLADLLEHRRARINQSHEAPTLSNAPGWLVDYLAAGGNDDKTGLDAEFFDHKLSNGEAIVLLDGLDEAPSEDDRQSLVELIARAARAYPGCRFVVTSRPAAYRGDVVLSGFETVLIDPLDDDAIKRFLSHWYEALYPDSRPRAHKQRDELLTALNDRFELRRLASTPVMLTAMAVIHWNENRLPEQRADLYESVIGWLARSRKRGADEQGRERESDDRCIDLLQQLALAMQDHPQGRKVQVPRHWAAKQIAPAWREVEDDKQRLATAMRFLTREETDSGIVVGRGDHVRYWHLTFQEFLAARALAACREAQQRELLFRQGKFYKPEWREVVLLLAGVLHHQGKEQVDTLIEWALDDLNRSAFRRMLAPWSRLSRTLAAQARCLGLLGAAVRDLSPYDYQPNDERYKPLLNAVMAIFDRQKSQSVPIKTAIEAAEALGQSGDPRFLPGNAEKNWGAIPAGEFVMGEKDEARRVYLDGYEIGRYPVTVLEYRRFVNAGGYKEKQCWRAGGFGQTQKPAQWEEQLLHPTRPVVDVTWYEASAYAAWAGCCLPTEAQWECAARGAEGREYPWGNEPPNPSLCNYDKSKIGHPTPVGVYPRGATPGGICDLAGNVWEWCLDEWHNRRVLRGGAFHVNSRFVRAAYRDRNHPDFRDNAGGFRLARTHN